MESESLNYNYCNNLAFVYPDPDKKYWNFEKIQRIQMYLKVYMNIHDNNNNIFPSQHNKILQTQLISH